MEQKSCGHIEDLFDEQWPPFMKVTSVLRTLNTCEHPHSLSLETNTYNKHLMPKYLVQTFTVILNTKYGGVVILISHPFASFSGDKGTKFSGEKMGKVRQRISLILPGSRNRHLHIPLYLHSEKAVHAQFPLLLSFHSLLRGLV